MLFSNVLVLKYLSYSLRREWTFILPLFIHAFCIQAMICVLHGNHEQPPFSIHHLCDVVDE